jgi:uncharacterized protein (DUF362 family)
MIDYYYMVHISIEQGKNRRNLARSVLKDLPDFIDRIKKAKKIFIKPNLIHHERGLAVTHLDTVRGTLDSIREHTQAPIIIGDAGFTGTLAAIRHFGYDLLEEEYEKITVIDLNDDKWIEGEAVRADGEISPIRRAKTAHDADFRISIAPIKIHKSLGLSCSIENWCFGTWLVPARIGPLGRVWARWPWLEEQGDVAAHKTIAKLHQDLPFQLAINDGVLAMEGDGPIDGDALDMQIMLASFDPLAADAVAATLLGLEPQDIGYLNHLSNKNLGVIDLARINVPPMIMAEAQRHAITPHSYPEKLRLWRE